MHRYIPTLIPKDHPIAQEIPIGARPPMPDFDGDAVSIDFSGVLGIPPKVEYGHAKDPIIRDERQGD